MPSAQNVHSSIFLSIKWHQKSHSPKLSRKSKIVLRNGGHWSMGWYNVMVRHCIVSVVHHIDGQMDSCLY